MILFGILLLRLLSVRTIPTGCSILHQGELLLKPNFVVLQLQKANGSEIFCVCNTCPSPIAENSNPHPFTPHLPTPVPARK